MTNDQWMTIATNIANKSSNWSNGNVSDGALNRGHSNTLNTHALAATNGEGSGTEKRTHTLSNGEVIWDMAGNVWEWTSYRIDQIKHPNVVLAQQTVGLLL